MSVLVSLAFGLAIWDVIFIALGVPIGVAGIAINAAYVAVLAGALVAIRRQRRLPIRATDRQQRPASHYLWDGSRWAPQQRKS